MIFDLYFWDIGRDHINGHVPNFFGLFEKIGIFFKEIMPIFSNLIENFLEKRNKKGVLPFLDCFSRSANYFENYASPEFFQIP